MVFCKGEKIVATFILVIIFLAFIPGLPIENSYSTDGQKDVSVMYAGSLVKIMEQVIGPSFHNQTGYNFIGEGKGSVQVSNLILQGFRRPDFFISADTLPIEKLINHSPP